MIVYIFTAPAPWDAALSLSTISVPSLRHVCAWPAPADCPVTLGGDSIGVFAGSADGAHAALPWNNVTADRPMIDSPKSTSTSSSAIKHPGPATLFSGQCGSSYGMSLKRRLLFAGAIRSRGMVDNSHG
ncbi:uncharacterized protein LOC144160857 [Haemaphysalis longicornis]